MLKVKNKDTILLSTKYHRRRSGSFIVNFKHISSHLLVLLPLTLNKKMFAGK